VLTEPASVVAKAWEQVERVGKRSWFEPRRVLVTGGGSIGLLAAFLGRQRGLDTHVLDRVTSGPKPSLVQDLGAVYHSDDAERVIGKVRPDLIIQATGAGSLVLASIACLDEGTEIVFTGCNEQRTDEPRPGVKPDPDARRALYRRSTQARANRPATQANTDSHSPAR
jgi:threonine dehydrogenase-like Zn-dependent dehydrogenase